MKEQAILLERHDSDIKQIQDLENEVLGARAQLNREWMKQLKEKQNDNGE